MPIGRRITLALEEVPRTPPGYSVRPIDVQLILDRGELGVAVEQHVEGVVGEVALPSIELADGTEEPARTKSSTSWFRKSWSAGTVITAPPQGTQS